MIVTSRLSKRFLYHTYLYKMKQNYVHSHTTYLFICKELHWGNVRDVTLLVNHRGL